MPRSTRRFTSDESPWAAIEEWAVEERFRLRHADDVRRLYRRGIGFTAAPAYLEVIYAAPWVHLQAWVGVNMLVRPSALLIAPGEMSLDSRGWRLARSRRRAAASVNVLLSRLGLEEIG